MMYSQIIAWAAGAYVIILALISAILLVKCLKDDKPAGLIIFYSKSSVINDFKQFYFEIQA